MKVLLINGSPNKEGCTYTALTEVVRGLESGGVQGEIMWVGNKPLNGCIACRACYNGGGCVFKDEALVTAQEKMREADGLILGAPVHYASAAGNAVSLYDRLFYSGGAEMFNLKPAAAVVSARRGGTTAALERLEKYFGISGMLTVGSSYWNMVHGNTPAEVLQDEEGLHTMYTLGQNMAWVLQCQAAAEKAGVQKPERLPKPRTNFIR